MFRIIDSMAGFESRRQSPTSPMLRKFSAPIIWLANQITLVADSVAAMAHTTSIADESMNNIADKRQSQSNFHCVLGF